MARRLFKFLNGKVVEVTPTQSFEGHSVHDDTMPALRHPVNGKYYTSKSAYIKATKAMGLRIAGNDLQSEKPMNLPEKVTDSVILDRIEKAESILGDNIKLAEYTKRSEAALERYNAVRRQAVAFGIERMRDE